jgi:NAD(P)-dependent dehydrogenase (short-subunit alcohol dehydrogenase family)
MIYSEADFATMVNLAGFFHVSQRAAAAMVQQHRGHIVTITTSLVDQPMAAVPAALAAITKGGWTRSHGRWQSRPPRRTGYFLQVLIM